MAFLTKYRTLTAYLMSLSPLSPTPSKTLPTSTIQRASGDINNLIAGYALSNDGLSDGQERIDNLEAVVRIASRTAALLFAQPTFWDFDWSGAGPVVFPALVRLTDENGAVLRDKVVVVGGRGVRE